MNKEAIKEAREALDNMDDYARMNTGVNAIGPRGVLERFISEVERTTSPVSQMTDEMRSALMFNAELFESHGFIDQARHLRDIVAAAAQAAPGPDPAPIYKHHDDGTVTLTNTGKMPSYADIDKVAWKIHEAHAAQPQPVAEQGAQRIHPPEFPKFCASSIEGTMSPEDLWDYACLTGWRTGHFAASQQAAEPVATKWAIYYDNLGEQPYTSAWMAEWHLYNSEEEARAQIAHFTFGKHYIPKKVEVYLADAAPTIQQPQDERAAIEEAAKAIYPLLPGDEQGSPADHPWQEGGNSNMQDLARRMARAAVAKKGGAA